jgi:hypothetical protein
MQKMMTFVFTLVLMSALNADDLRIIAHYTFDNDNGKTVLTDSGPNKLDAVLFSETAGAKIVTVDGKAGKALQLDNTTLMRFDLPVNPAVNELKPPYTIAFWAKTDVVNKRMTVIGCYADTGFEGFGAFICWQMLDYRWGVNNANKLLTTDRFTVLKGEFQHFAVVNDGSRITLYINAEPMKSLEGAADLIPAACRRKLAIGNCPGTRMNAYPFTGLLDDLYIIGKALNADEIMDIASAK